MKLTARQRSQLPACYYEGFLEKRSFKDKTSLKLWTCLCGNALFFFNEKRDPNYIDKVDLSGFVSITDDSTQDRNLDAARLCLQLKDGNIRFTAPNPEARELWKGYIRSVAELSVPVCLTLLPGQIHMLKETVEMEKLRINHVPASNSPNSLKGNKPACFHNIPRLEAELLLEREVKRGNLLLRPGSKGNSFAVTTRQDLDGPVIRHYLVTPKPNRGFVIDVDQPVLCATLHDVITYLVSKTDGYLIPLVAEDVYEKRISFIYKDFENGEKGVQEASTSPVSPDAPPRKVASRTPTPEPIPAQPEEDNFYLNDELVENEEETEDVSAPALPQLDKKAPKKAMMPPVLASAPAPVVVRTPVRTPIRTSVRTPVPVPRSVIPCSTNSRDQITCTIPNSKRQIPLETISELKLKFEQQARS